MLEFFSFIKQDFKTCKLFATSLKVTTTLGVTILLGVTTLKTSFISGSVIFNYSNIIY